MLDKSLEDRGGGDAWGHVDFLVLQYKPIKELIYSSMKVLPDLVYNWRYSCVKIGEKNKTSRNCNFNLDSL